MPPKKRRQTKLNFGSPASSSASTNLETPELDDLNDLDWDALAQPATPSPKAQSLKRQFEPSFFEGLSLDDLLPWNPQELGPHVNTAEQIEAEIILRKFDLAPAYGPARGITRRERYNRAAKLALHPPRIVDQILSNFDAEFSTSVWDRNLK